MTIQNDDDCEVKIIDENDKVIFTLYRNSCIDVLVDVRKMIDWKVKYPDGKIVYLFDIFNDALTHVDVNLNRRLECSYDEDYRFIMNTMPHNIQ